MPARQGHDGRSRVFEADGTLGLDVHLEGAVVLALSGIGIIIAIGIVVTGIVVRLRRGILAWSVGLETDSVT